jgi:hypothetical protein
MAGPCFAAKVAGTYNLGVTADAACDCGAPYVPVGARAVEAIKGNPKKSNRAIAGELGVDEKMVRIARKKAGAAAECSAPGKRVGKDGDIQRDALSDLVYGRRIGKDGKSYPAKSKRPDLRLCRRRRPAASFFGLAG